MTDQEFLKKIGQRIAEARKAKGLSQVDVCAKLKMDKPYLSSIENGRQNITLITLKHIANSLGVHFEDLMPNRVIR